MAVVAAGGRGTRFAQAGGSGSKLLAPVDGKPVLARLLENLLSVEEIDRVLVMLRHGADHIEAALGSWDFGDAIVPLSIAAEHTGGALAEVADLLGGTPLLYTDGDVFAPPSLYRRLARSLRESPEGSLVCVSPDIHAPTHLMFGPAHEGDLRPCGQGLEGDIGSHVSLGVIAVGSAFSSLLPRLADGRDLDYVLCDALAAPEAVCSATLHEGPWTALHYYDDLEHVEMFFEGMTHDFVADRAR